MIKVDCRDVEFLKYRMSIYVSDRTAMIPSLKSHEFLLSPIDDDEKIDSADVIASIKEFLYAIGKAKSFDVTEHENVILIKSIQKKS